MINGIYCGFINPSKTLDGLISVGTGTVDMLTFGNSDSVFKAAEWLGGKLWDGLSWAGNGLWEGAKFLGNGALSVGDGFLEGAGQFGKGLLNMFTLGNADNIIDGVKGWFE